MLGMFRVSKPVAASEEGAAVRVSGTYAGILGAFFSLRHTGRQHRI